MARRWLSTASIMAVIAGAAVLGVSMAFRGSSVELSTMQGPDWTAPAEGQGEPSVARLLMPDLTLDADNSGDA